MGMDDLVDGGAAWSLGVAIVVGAALLAAKGGRPLAKRAIKGYLVLSERLREFSAEAAEQLQDIYAEARAELAEHAEDLAAEAAPAAPAAGPRGRRGTARA